MSMTEQVKRVRAAMRAAGFRAGEFRVSAERIYRGRKDGKAIYEYGDTRLYIYTGKRFTPAIAKQLVETGDIGAEIHLQHQKTDNQDIAPYTLMMRFTSRFDTRGKYKLFVASKSVTLREENLAGGAYMSRVIAFDEFERLWNNMQHFDIVTINAHRFELRFSNVVVNDEARTLCEVFPLDWERDEDEQREPVFAIADFGAKFAKEQVIKQLMSERLIILADEQTHTRSKRVDNTLVLYKGARLILSSWQYRSRALNNDWASPVYSVAVVTHLDAAPASQYEHIEERIITDSRRAKIFVVDNVAYIAPRGRARNLHPSFASKREAIRLFANALDSLIEQTLAAHLDSLIEQQREQEQQAFETVSALSRL